MGKPIHSRHDNGVPLKSALCVPSIFRACIGIVCTVNRAVLGSLWLSVWFPSGITSPLSMIPGMVGIALAVLPVSRTVGEHRRTKGRRKGHCVAFRGVRFLLSALAVIRHKTLPVLWQLFIGRWCPSTVCLFFGISRWSDIMGIGQEDTTDIPACQEMQGVYGSAVVGSGGQHTEPVKAVYEFAYRLSVAT